MGQQANIVSTVVATGAIAPKRGVNFSGAQATAGQACIGVADTAIAIGDAGRVVMGMTAFWEAGAVIDGTENRLMTDAEGRVIPWTSTNNVCARLVPGVTAGGAGEIILVYPVVDVAS